MTLPPDPFTGMTFQGFNSLDEMFEAFTEEGEKIEAAIANDPVAQEVTAFLIKTISEVYAPGVSAIHDEDGLPPCQYNNYFLSEDGKTFTGTFVDATEDREFDFKVTEGKNGQWSMVY